MSNAFYSWASDDQLYCIQLLIRLFLGEHHLKRKNIKPFGKGIRYVVYCPGLATFDFDRLTRLVLLSHEMCIRAEVTPRAFNFLSIELFKRKRFGAMHERHPSIDEAISIFKIGRNKIEDARCCKFCKWFIPMTSWSTVNGVCHAIAYGNEVKSTMVCGSFTRRKYNENS